MRPVRQGWVSYVEAKALPLIELIILNLEIDLHEELQVRDPEEESD